MSVRDQETGNELRIFSQTERNRWHPIERSIWARDSGVAQDDAALSIVRTLLDQPRWVEPRFLYDERGSQLFEKVCSLPEYYLTRTEDAILEKEAGRIIDVAPVECVVELGAGFSKKTARLLKEQARQRGRSTFAPIDVSLTALAGSRDAVEGQFPEIDFSGLYARYEEGISSIEKDIPTLFAFLGSSVGNFDQLSFARFFHLLGTSMGPNDFLLLGVDRIKEVEILEKAYSDSQGVTAEFILNIFTNINRIVGTDFDLDKMQYYSWYNPQWQQMEIYAIATSDQEIHLPSLGSAFVWKKGERILVEISRKFEPEQLQQQLQFFGFKPMEHFTDSKQWFSLLLFEKASQKVD
ncbi:L-histidine N(alpha)-methyltransferase [Acidobacteria bacterium AH-259-O06]|nr:L-histidine N(alpha)-methyltransferase [Acidobacteria bacterium AH-259-O06]